MQNRQFHVYIMASASRRLYVGVTNNLIRRVAEHCGAGVEAFAGKYAIRRLVYFETTPNIHSAITREKQIKGWRREKKITLIENTNPAWRDLAADW